MDIVKAIKKIDKAIKKLFVKNKSMEIKASQWGDGLRHKLKISYKNGDDSKIINFEDIDSLKSLHTLIGDYIKVHDAINRDPINNYIDNDDS